MSLPFLKSFKKALGKLENVSTGFSAPTYWYTTGNFALNKVLSGSYLRGIPQGRISSFVGPSAVGKSFIACNVIREAQVTGATVLVMDSENALDPVFMKRAGIDVDSDNLIYTQVVTLQDVTSVLSEFLTSYEKEYGRFNRSAPRVLVLLDSLGNCLTDADDEKFEKGIAKGDQGQRAKVAKGLLRTLVPRLDRCNTTFDMTDQVYPQDPLLGDGPWAVTHGLKYSASQIAMMTKLKLKEETEIIGIKMRIETYKSRFAKPGTKIELEIPYNVGLTQIAGLLDAFVLDGVVKQGGAWYTTEIDESSIKFQRREFDLAFAMTILSKHKLIQKQEEDFLALQSVGTVEEIALLTEQPSEPDFANVVTD